MKKPYTITSLLGLLAAGTTAQAAVLLQDDFNSGSTPPDAGRVFEFLRNTGWQATTGWAGNGNVPSNWDITGGQLVNPTADAGAHYVAGESPVWQWWTNPAAGSSTDTTITVDLDYAVGSGDSLTIHFWAVQTGGTPTTTNTWITNNQGWANGNSGQNEDVSNGGYDTFNLLDGDTTPDNGDHISGVLSGSGSFNWQVDVSTLGIPGVSTVGDIDEFFIAVAGNETGGGSSSIDNLSINSVPEPSSTALLGLGGLALILRRRK